MMSATGGFSSKWPQFWAKRWPTIESRETYIFQVRSGKSRVDTIARLQASAKAPDFLWSMHPPSDPFFFDCLDLLKRLWLIFRNGKSTTWEIFLWRDLKFSWASRRKNPRLDQWFKRDFSPLTTAHWLNQKENLGWSIQSFWVNSKVSLQAWIICHLSTWSQHHVKTCQGRPKEIIGRFCYKSTSLESYANIY